MCAERYVGLDGLEPRSDWKELAATLSGHGCGHRGRALLMIPRGGSDC